MKKMFLFFVMLISLVYGQPDLPVNIFRAHNESYGIRAEAWGKGLIEHYGNFDKEYSIELKSESDTVWIDIKVEFKQVPGTRKLKLWFYARYNTTGNFKTVFKNLPQKLVSSKNRYPIKHGFVWDFDAERDNLVLNEMKVLTYETIWMIHGPLNKTYMKEQEKRAIKEHKELIESGRFIGPILDEQGTE